MQSSLLKIISLDRKLDFDDISKTKIYKEIKNSKKELFKNKLGNGKIFLTIDLIFTSC